MMITLGEFIIANGQDRTVQALADDSLDMTQQTQVVVLTRDDAPTAFPERSTRSVALSYSVGFPACASMAEAVMQSRTVPASCPRGGVLVEQQGATQVTYEQAWVTSIRVERLGVSNRFVFNLTATNPSTVTLSTLAQYDMRYAANLHTITGLTGGGESNLDGYITTDVAVGFLAIIKPTLAGLVQTKLMSLITDPAPGETVTNDDPAAGTLIVLPLDYDEESNAKIWTE
jgi:hypothetical protein